MRNVFGILLFVAVLVVLAPASRAQWYLWLLNDWQNSFVTDTGFNADPFGTALASSSATVGAGDCDLRSKAYDATRFYASSANANGSSSRYEMWIHVGPNVGEVELWKSVRVEGYADFRDGPCSAVAVGVARVAHRFDAQPEEVLEQWTTAALGATSISSVGSQTIAVDGRSFTISGIVQYGAGLRYDRPAAALRYHQACPVTIFQIEYRSEGFVESTADAAPVFDFTAVSQADFLGRTGASFMLISLPACP